MNGVNGIARDLEKNDAAVSGELISCRAVTLSFYIDAYCKSTGMLVSSLDLPLRDVNEGGADSNEPFFRRPFVLLTV